MFTNLAQCIQSAAGIPAAHDCGLDPGGPSNLIVVISDGLHDLVNAKKGDRACASNQAALVGAVSAALDNDPHRVIAFMVLPALDDSSCPAEDPCPSNSDRCVWQSLASDSTGGSDHVALIKEATDHLNRKIRAGLPAMVHRPYGGVLTQEADVFSDTVALEGAGGRQCTGILVGERIVLTAAHCLPLRTAIVADDHVRLGRTIAVAAHQRHPDPAVDAALVRLAEGPNLPLHLRRAAKDDDAPSGVLRAVGFGTDATGRAAFGRRKVLDVPANGWGCDAARVGHSGCTPGAELVLSGSIGRDTCWGDSGGPIFELFGDGQVCGWRLVGIASRGLPWARGACGSGGIYTRVDALDDWMKQVSATWEQPDNGEPT